MLPRVDFSLHRRFTRQSHYRATILAGACAHVLMHNHRSCDPDRRLTQKIENAGKILEISLLDHVIVGAPEAGCAPCLSFKEAGLL